MFLKESIHKIALSADNGLLLLFWLFLEAKGVVAAITTLALIDINVILAFVTRVNQ